jgi:hypothetical protein
MDKAYLICAIVGGSLWICMFLMSLMGGGHEDGGHDASFDGHAESHGGADHDVSGHEGALAWLVGLVTLRSLIAGLTFFGLGGLAAQYADFSKLNSFGVAVACGLGGLIFMGLLMRMLTRLESEGNIRIEGAVGKVGTVYLTIPANKTGAGKVTLKLQHRLVEFQAVSAGEELPTGREVVVVSVVSPETVEVIPAKT